MKIKIKETWYDITKVDLDNHCYWYISNGNAYAVDFCNAIIEKI